MEQRPSLNSVSTFKFMVFSRGFSHFIHFSSHWLMNLYFCDQFGKISWLNSNGLADIMDILISLLYTATSGEVLAVLNMSVVQHSQAALKKALLSIFLLMDSNRLWLWWCFDWIIINRRSVYFCRNSFSVFLFSNRPCRQILTSLTICLGVFSQLIAYCAAEYNLIAFNSIKLLVKPDLAWFWQLIQPMWSGLQPWFLLMIYHCWALNALILNWGPMCIVSFERIKLSIGAPLSESCKSVFMLWIVDVDVWTK